MISAVIDVRCEKIFNMLMLDLSPSSRSHDWGHKITYFVFLANVIAFGTLGCN